MPNPSFFTAIINQYLPEPHASLLNGILFGIDLKTTRSFYTSLKETGLLHLVVLSGTNITLLAAICNSVFVYFGKRISCLISILIIILFIIFVGPKAPIVRSGIMGILTIVALLIGRKSYALYSMIISLIAIALVYPEWFNGISLYLSYAATLGILLFSPNQVRKPNAVYDELRISLGAQVFTAPLIFIFFRQVSLVSPLSNLLVSWTIFPLMIFGFLSAVLGAIHFSLGYVPALICYGILSYMIAVIKILQDIPYAFISFI